MTGAIAMSQHWQKIFVLFSLLAAAVTFALAIVMPLPAPPLRVGINDWIGYEPLLIARDRQLFDPSDLRPVELQATTEVLRGLKSGVLEAAALTLDEALLLAHEGLDITVVAVADISQGADAVLKHPRWTDDASLNGALIAYEGKAVGAYMLARMIEKLHLDAAELNLAEVPAFLHERAYRSGQYDAIVTFEPFRSRLLAEGAREVFSSRQIPDEIVDVLIVRSDVLTSSSERVDKLLAAWEAGRQQLLDKRSDAAMAGVVTRSGLTADELDVVLKGLYFPDLAQSTSLINDHEHGLPASARRLWGVMQRTGLVADDAEYPNLWAERG